MKQAVVTVTRCPVMRVPTLECEQVDELLLGWSAALLEQAAPDWFRVRSSYGYEGFAPAGALCAGAEQTAAFAALPKRVVTRAVCPVLSAPRVQGWVVAELVRGALVSPASAPDGDGWVAITLPDGKTGYTKSSTLSKNYGSPCGTQAALRRSIACAALSYLGAPYRWGGKSPLGIDCSGLAFMAYWLNGITIFRDARMEPDFPVRAIPKEKMNLGDLLYFPGHVAVYLDSGLYIHATAQDGSDGVVINSLDPSDACYREDLAHSLLAVGSIFP